MGDLFESPGGQNQAELPKFAEAGGEQALRKTKRADRRGLLVPGLSQTEQDILTQFLGPGQDFSSSPFVTGKPADAIFRENAGERGTRGGGGPGASGARSGGGAGGRGGTDAGGGARGLESFDGAGLDAELALTGGGNVAAPGGPTGAQVVLNALIAQAEGDALGRAEELLAPSREFALEDVARRSRTRASAFGDLFGTNAADFEGRNVARTSAAFDETLAALLPQFEQIRQGAALAIPGATSDILGLAGIPRNIRQQQQVLPIQLLSQLAGGAPSLSSNPAFGPSPGSQAIDIGLLLASLAA